MKKCITAIIVLIFSFLYINTVYAAGDTWTAKGDFGGGGYDYATGFSIGNKGYIGVGYDGDYSKELWEYDSTADSWTQKNDFPGNKRMSATGFSIGTKGYVGLGASSTSTFYNDFYEYDPATNAWTQKANLGCNNSTSSSCTGIANKRTGAAGFSIGTKGYLGTGAAGTSTFYYDFYEYDPSTNAWTKKADFPHASPATSGRGGATGFSIGNKGYIGLGGYGNSSTKLLQDFYEYDPVANTWTTKTPFPGLARGGAVGFTIGSKGYVGTGGYYILLGGSAYYNDFYEFDPTGTTTTSGDGKWTQKSSLPGPRYSAAGFSIGSRGYIGTGYDGDRFSDFYEYEPTDTTPDPFTFTDHAGVALNTVITSNTITVSGINTPAAISITGGTYSINGGAAGSTVNNGDTVTVKVTSSTNYSTTTEATLTIGGVSDTFSVTTLSMPVVKNDFDGSGNSDIPWRKEATGQVSLWFMNTDGTMSGSKTLITDPSWTVVGTGYFNGDNIADILWRQASTGKVTLWFMNTDGTRSDYKPLISDVAWTVADTGDFNGDGISDILWRQASTGKVTLWFMNTDGTRSDYQPLISDVTWTVADTGDFNGDGISDILWRQESSGKVVLWFMNADGTRMSIKTLIIDPTWTIVGTGNFSSDGISDILWRQASTGKIVLWFMNDDGTRAGYKKLVTDSTWTVAGTGDFDADGISDILWRQASTGKATLWFMNDDGTYKIGVYKILLTDPAWTIVGQ